MALSQVFKDSLALPGSTYAMWLEIEGLDFAWGTAGGLDASAFLHRARRYRRTAAKALLSKQPAGVEQGAVPLDGVSTIGSLLVELVDDGTADVMALVANTARTDNLLPAQVEKEWAPSTVYAVGDLVRPRASSTASGNRNWFRCTTLGTSAASEPAWPNSGTVADNTVTWTFQDSQDLPADLYDARIPYAGTADATAYPTGGGVIYVGRETFRYTARTTAPNGGGFFDGCRRAWFELDGRTQTHAHTAGDLISPYPRFVATRRARLYLAPGAITNLVRRSQEFDDTAWGKFNSTVTANTWTAPDGTATGDTITDNATNAQHGVNQTLSMVGPGFNGVSVFCQAGTLSQCRLSLDDVGGPVFDLVAKTASQVPTGGTARLVDLGDSTFRAEWVTSPNFAPSNPRLTVALLSAGADVYVGGTGTFKVWGAQVRRGDVVGRYVPTTSAPASATNDTGAAVARYTGTIRRPTMMRGLTGAGLEVESSEVEMRVTAMGNRRTFKLRAGVEAGDFVNKDSASTTDLTTYERQDEQAPKNSTGALEVDAATLSGAALPDETVGFTRTWRLGDEYIQGHLYLPDSRLYFSDFGPQVAADGRGYFSSAWDQHDPGDEALEVLPLGSPPRFEEFFFDGFLNARNKIDFKHNGTAATATIAASSATAMRFRTTAALAQAVKDALYAAWPNVGTNFWGVSFDSAGRTLISYTDPTSQTIELLWRTGANSGVNTSARFLLGFPKQDVLLASSSSVVSDTARSLEPAAPFHFTEEPDHPLNIVLRLLLSRGDGTNGAYDVYPRGFGLGVDQSRVDVAGVEALRDYWMPEARHFEIVDEPFTVKDKIGSILRAYGCYLVTLLDDKITVRRMSPPVPGTPLRAIDGTAVLEPATWEVDPARAIGRILYNCDHDPGHSSTELGPWRQRFTSELQGPGIEVQEQYSGLFQTHTIEAPGQWTGNNLAYGGRFGPNVGTGAFEAAQRAFELIRDRAARPLPGIRVPASYDTLDVEVGDLGSVTLPQVPNAATGGRGLTAVVFEVLAKSIEDERGTIHLALAQTAYGDRMRLVAPAGKVATTQNSATIALSAVYSPPGVANEASQFVVGDSVEVFDPTLKTSRGTGTVATVGATSITVGAAINQTAGDVVLLRAFTNQPTARKAKSAFLADTSPQAVLGGGAAHVWAS